MTAVISNVFGRVVSAAQLEKAVLATLKEWMPDYLPEMENQFELKKNSLTVPLNYINRNSFDFQLGEDLPLVCAVSPGIEGQPQMIGHNQYRAMWNMGVGVVMGAMTEELANDQVKAYGAAVRKILLDKQTLGGFPGIAQIILVGENYPDLDVPNAHQNMKSAAVYFLIDVEDVVTARHGPKVHSQPHYGEVQDVNITLVKEELEV